MEPTGRKVKASLALAAALAVMACGEEDAVLVPPEPSPPVITGLDPAVVLEGAGAFDLTVLGSGFDSSVVILVDGGLVTIRATSADRVIVEVPAGVSSAPDTIPVQAVVSGAPASNVVHLAVRARPAAPVQGPEIEPGLISGGGNTTCARAVDGAVHCWGAPWNVDPTRPEPVEVAGSVVEVRVERRDGENACALVDDGELHCWGRNDAGQLGRGTVASGRDHHPPEPVAGGLRFVDFDVGLEHACGVTREGEVHCWGDNEHGQLGRGGDGSALPEAVVLPGPMVQVAARTTASCALDPDGRVHCWGKYNWHADEREDPLLAPLPPLASIVGSGTSGCGLDGEGALYCFYRLRWPMMFRPEFDGRTKFRSVAADGPTRGCGLGLDGGALCWGSNSLGLLGNGPDPRGRRREPGPVAGDRTFQDIASSGDHACAIDDGGTPWCWGDDREGQLGTGGGATRYVPTPAAEPHRFLEVASSSTSVCGRSVAGGVVCWGGAAEDAYGVVTWPDPVVVDGSNGLGSLAVSEGGGCGLDAAGAARCWDADPEPVARSAAGALRFDTLVAGDAHTCGIDDAGATWCWGDGALGRLGHGAFDSATRDAPARVVGDHAFVQLTAGPRHTCGIDAEGRAWCWGSDGVSELGAYTDELCSGARCASRPLPVEGGHRWAALFAGATFTCGARVDGEWFCWGGWYADGACRSPVSLCADVPRRVDGGPDFVTLAPSDGRVCGLDADGRAWCFGDRLPGSPDAGASPAEAAALEGGTVRYRSVAHTRIASCGLTVEGAVRCWGRPGDGAFGDGWTPVAWYPRRVAGDVVFGR